MFHIQALMAMGLVAHVWTHYQSRSVVLILRGGKSVRMSQAQFIAAYEV